MYVAYISIIYQEEINKYNQILNSNKLMFNIRGPVCSIFLNI